ncbi:MAG: sigma-70 family RNA polymerase sigma factor [Acidobacteria bacterium]|nr:sigma-70 family RNA polymerase sigma factor [Acidobacteriota bacterium]
MTLLSNPVSPLLEDSKPAAADPALLVERARRGDRAAFEGLYRSHVGRVNALCLRLTASVERAEELTQEVFVRAFTAISSFDGGASLATWLHRIAVNAVFGERRSRSRRDRHVVAVSDLELLDRTVPKVTYPGSDLDLERGIAGLPERARTVFVLHDVEGYAHHEIAEMTGMAEGTSKAQLHRARNLLRKALRR